MAGKYLLVKFPAKQFRDWSNPKLRFERPRTSYGCVRLPVSMATHPTGFDGNPRKPGGNEQAKEGNPNRNNLDVNSIRPLLSCDRSLHMKVCLAVRLRVCLSLVCLFLCLFVSLWSGLAWSGLVWSGLVWSGQVCLPD